MKIVYLDGVAPRAKINQQRSRRFKAAFDRERNAQLFEEIKKDSNVPKECSESVNGHVSSWDSNAITPGTPFMDKVTAFLKYYVIDRLNTEKAWQNVYFLNI